MGKTHEEVIDMIKGRYMYSISHMFILSSGNSHVALTLLCRSSGSNGTKPQQTFGLSRPMAAGAAKGRMYICTVFITLYCNVYHHISIILNAHGDISFYYR